MTRRELFAAVQALRDAVRLSESRHLDNPRYYRLLGSLERMEHALCCWRLRSLREDIVALTILRLEASAMDLYTFRRRPSERWIAKYRCWATY